MNDIFEKLRRVRMATDLKLKPSRFLKQTICKPDGTEVPLTLRTYQVQMVYHMLTQRRFLCGDDAGLGKTLESIATICYLWEKEPDLLPVIVTTTSAMRQWAGEVAKFCEGVGCLVAEGGPEAREKVYVEFFGNADPAHPRVLITNYPRLRNDKLALLGHMEGRRVVLFLDEATTVKSTTSQAHNAAYQIAQACERVYGMTATLIKNNLLEGYGIFRVVQPKVFSTKQAFIDTYCVTKLQPIGGGRKVKVVVGHTKSHIELFKGKIDPFYLGRAKHEVAKELPVLTTREIQIPMTTGQWAYYEQALEGLLVINEGGEEEQEIETTKLTKLIYCQEIVDHPMLIGNDGASAKLDYLLALLEEELAQEKVIIFSRFRKMVDIMAAALEAKGFSYGVAPVPGSKDFEPRADLAPGTGYARVTGNEGGAERDAARRAFTETDGTNIIFLTMAGAEAMNLQQARVMIFFDLPWSAGDYIQLVGRMIRIGSPHQSVYTMHLLSEGPAYQNTIDHYITATLNRKMGFIEGALGERILGNAEDGGGDKFLAQSDADDIFRQLVAQARKMQAEKQGV